MQPSVAASFRRWAKLERRALPPPSALLSRMRSSALQRRVLRSAASRLLVCTLKCRPQSPSARSSEPPSHAPLSDKPEPRTGILLRLPSPAPLETAASSMHSVPPAIASNTRRPPAEISGGMVPLSDRNNAAHELDSSLIGEWYHRHFAPDATHARRRAVCTVCITLHCCGQFALLACPAFSGRKYQYDDRAPIAAGA